MWHEHEPFRLQVSWNGGVRVVSGVGGKGTSYMTLSGGKGLGPDGAHRLADLLFKAPSQILEFLDLRNPLSYTLALSR
jgi:hypothetical protein